MLTTNGRLRTYLDESGSWSRPSPWPGVVLVAAVSFLCGAIGGALAALIRAA